ncbi:hypothetical protein K431DRAFT_284840 [Polychaeton citri CBS 116435]|uniref:SPX domain-containing protein n=1 Tax=Polychaeton citri CBS 116435 TaxID=1314669 RepID=A0A9P4Q8K5_9PEZI|nr:hypothetical protein K431DRAFT_284840 [Polychaeton citri CBS 116435]
MKYGETLRQRSIPQWSHHNIDYDEIKHYIKEQTTHGKGKSVAIPGRGDEKLKHFENTLFDVLVDQHSRIDLFVRSKVGEIQRRLLHAKRQLELLRSKNYATDRRIPVRRLERYSRLENDVMKAGDEIKSLSRFVGAQRTALRKLIKKYKKWTGSKGLEDRVSDEVLSDPKGFTKLDLGPLLDLYSATLLSIRSLYENRMQQPTPDSLAKESSHGGTSTSTRLASEIVGGSKKSFDAAFAQVPVSEQGILATYFVHPDNVVELLMLLLEHTQHLTASRRNSSAEQDSPRPQSGGTSIDYNEEDVCCSRSRLVGLNNSSRDVLLTTLDEHLTNGSFDFPFSVLRVRKEGSQRSVLLSTLDKSHLAERVHDVPLGYKDIFGTFESTDASKPAWHSLLSQDIRRLPPPASSKPDDIASDGPGETSATQVSTSSGSVAGYTAGSTTAAEDSRPVVNPLPDLGETPPLRSFRKKRRRPYQDPASPGPASQRYWSEYDHPEQGEGDEDAYVIYIDPNEKSMLDRMLERLGGMFSSRRTAEQDPLLDGGMATPTEDEVSSDEEASISKTTRRGARFYGALAHNQPASLEGQHFQFAEPPKKRFMPQLTAICMVASVAILVVAYILAATGKHKYAKEVDAGVIFAIASSLVFAIMGVASMLGRSDLAWTAWAMSVGLLIADAVCCGGLLAWMLG